MLDKMMVILTLVVWFPKPLAPGTCQVGKPTRFWQLVMAIVMIMMMSRRWQSFVPSGLEFLPPGLNIVVLQTFYWIQHCSLKLKVTIHKVHHLGVTTSIKITKKLVWIDDGDDFDKQDGWSYCSVFNNIVMVLIFEAMIMISKALSDVRSVCKGKRWWQIDCWLKDVPQTPLSQANNEPRYLDIKKQDYLRMNVAPVIKQ